MGILYALWWLFLAAVVGALTWYGPALVGRSPSSSSSSHKPGPSGSSGKAPNGEGPHAGNGTGGAGSAGHEHEEGAGGDEGEHGGPEDGSSSFGDSVRLKAQAPPGCTGEIARILNSRDHYAVLDIPRTASASDIKKAYRLKQMATHPDKNQGVVGALEASQRVNAANDVLSDEVRRRQYDVRLVDEEQYGPRSARRGKGASPASFAEAVRQFNEFVKETMPPPPEGAMYPTIDPAAYDTWGEAPDHTFRMACSCGYDHLATKVPDRTASQARTCYCSACGFLRGKRLPARDNDVWFEAPSSVLRQVHPEKFIKAYRCVGLFVYEITAWCRCNGMLVDAAGRPAPTNTHQVPFRLQGAASAKGGRQRAEKREKAADASYGFNQFKGKGVNSHKEKAGRRKGKR